MKRQTLFPFAACALWLAALPAAARGEAPLSSDTVIRQKPMVTMTTTQKSLLLSDSLSRSRSRLLFGSAVRSSLDLDASDYSLGGASDTLFNQSAKYPFRVRRPAGSPEPLVFIDGKEVPYSELENLSADRIQTFSVAKDEAVVSKYGDKAKGGVILITTKE